jgi:hypothetical protein
MIPCCTNKRVCSGHTTNKNVHNVQQTSYKQFMIMGPGADSITELEILTTQLNKTCTNLSVDSRAN